MASGRETVYAATCVSGLSQEPERTGYRRLVAFFVTIIVGPQVMVWFACDHEASEPAMLNAFCQRKPVFVQGGASVSFEW